MITGRHLLRSLTSARTLARNPTWPTLRSLPSARKFCDVRADKSYIDSTRNTPKYQLQPIDKFFLVVTGTMKKGEIPNEVSYEIVEKSQNRRRIMINILTIFLTIAGSAYAISQGRKARDFHTEDTMFERNQKRYQKIREEEAKKAALEKPTT